MTHALTPCRTDLGRMRRSQLGVLSDCAAASTLYMEATRCPGFTGFLPRIFVPASIVDGCYTGQMGLAYGTSRCYMVYPNISRTYTSGEVAVLGHVFPTGPGPILPPSFRNKNCCNCGSGICDTPFGARPICNGAVWSFVEDIPCCCSAAYRFVMAHHEELRTLTSFGYDIQTTDSNGSIEFDSAGGVVTRTGSNVYTQFTARTGATLVQTYPFPDGFLFFPTIAQCGQWFAGNLVFSHNRCPGTHHNFPNFGQTLVVSGTRVATCFTLTESENSTVTTDSTGVVQEIYTATSSSTVTPLGPCSGGCDGSQAGPSILAVAEEDWPIWAKIAKLARADDDLGVGDTIRRTIGDDTSEAFKAFYRSVTGQDCGCDGRRQRWNDLYPY